MTTYSTAKRRRSIATRNGRPAYENAPPRIRQSQVASPVQSMDYPRVSLLRRIWGRR